MTQFHPVPAGRSCDGTNDQVPCHDVEDKLPDGLLDYGGGKSIHGQTHLFDIFVPLNDDDGDDDGGGGIDPGGSQDDSNADPIGPDIDPGGDQDDSDPGVIDGDDDNPDIDPTGDQDPGDPGVIEDDDSPFDSVGDQDEGGGVTFSDRSCFCFGSSPAIPT